MEVMRIEFNDKDDPNSIPDGKIRITIAPEGFIRVLPNAKHLTVDDQVMFGKMLRLAYEQGKQIGKKLANEG